MGASSVGYHISLLTLALFLLYSYTRSITFKSLGALDPLFFFRLYTTVLPLGISAHIEEYQVLAILFLALAIVGIFSSLLSRRRGEKRLGVLLALAFLILPIGIFVLSVPLYYLILSQGIRFFWSRIKLIGGIVLALVLVCSGFMLKGYFTDRHRTYDLEAMAMLIEMQAEEGDAIVLNSDSDWPLYAYHINAGLDWFMIPSGARMTPAEADHWLKLLANKSKVWLLTTERAVTSDPKGEAKRWLSRHFNDMGEVAYGRCKLTLFSRNEGWDFLMVSPPRLSVRSRYPLTLGPMLFLGYDYLPDHLKTGDAFYLTSYWQALTDLDGVPPVKASLTDSAGNRLISRVPISPPGRYRWPKDAFLQMQHSLTIGPSTPSGTYELSLNVKEPASGALLSEPIKVINIEGEDAFAQHNKPACSTSVVLDNKVRLEGYSLSPNPIKPGQSST